MAKKVLIKDIAAVVGVSTALVSYVMNGREKEKRVGKDVVEKIRKAAKDLNYQPNQIARSLRTGSTNTIGLIVADISNPFFSHLARIIEDEANKYHYAVIIGSSDERAQKSQALVETLLNRQVDGLILVPSEGDDFLVKSLMNRKIPLILMDRYFENIASNFVVLNNYKATFDATKSLIDNGYRKITMVAYRSSLEHMKARINGYVCAMRSVGFTECIKLVEPHVAEFLPPLDEIILNTDTDAVLFATNTLSIAGLYAVSRNHLKVPEQLAIVGFDKSEVYDFFIPPITYIEQPLAEMGQKAVQNLMECINGNDVLMQISLDPQFIERLSNKKLV